MAEVAPHGVGQPFFLQRQRLVVLVLPGMELLVPVNLQEGILLDHHISMVAPPVIIGMAANV